MRSRPIEALQEILRKRRWLSIAAFVSVLLCGIVAAAWGRKSEHRWLGDTGYLRWVRNELQVVWVPWVDAPSDSNHRRPRRVSLPGFEYSVTLQAHRDPARNLGLFWREYRACTLSGWLLVLILLVPLVIWSRAVWLEHRSRCR